ADAGRAARRRGPRRARRPGAPGSRRSVRLARGATDRQAESQRADRDPYRRARGHASIPVIIPFPVPFPKSTVAVLLSRIAALMIVLCSLLFVVLPGSRNCPVLRKPPPLPQMLCGS